MGKLLVAFAITSGIEDSMISEASVARLYLSDMAGTK
jgi:hypothetical protein